VFKKRKIRNVNETKHSNSNLNLNIKSTNHNNVLSVNIAGFLGPFLYAVPFNLHNTPLPASAFCI
jgi:hypothetical protein